MYRILPAWNGGPLVLRIFLTKSDSQRHSHRQNFHRQKYSLQYLHLFLQSVIIHERYYITVVNIT